MKFIGIAALAALLFSCKTKIEQTAAQPAGTDTAPQPFFPVSSFIAGDIAQIKSIGITPLRKTMQGEKVLDSAWVRTEEYTFAFKDFLSDRIDSASMHDRFNAETFIDQSVNAVTFTYDPKPGLSPDFPVRHWDVYVDPETEKVRRIYIVKKQNGKQKQLTWQAGKWCRVIELDEASGKITGDVKIDWSEDQ